MLALFHGAAVGAIPIFCWRMRFEAVKTLQLKVIEFLARAGELAALFDQFARFSPFAATHRFKDVLVEGIERPEFWRRTHHRIAKNGEQFCRFRSRSCLEI